MAAESRIGDDAGYSGEVLPQLGDAGIAGVAGIDGDADVAEF